MFDNTTRNRLAAFVSSARRLLCGDYNKPGGEITAILQSYGIQPDGSVTTLDDVPDLDQRGYELGQTLRDILNHKRAVAVSLKAWGKYDPHVYDLIQEQAFTVLNRLCALRMAEERGILPYPVVSKGLDSESFELYEQVTDKKHLTRDERYAAFLFSVFDELSLDLGVLFDRFSPHGMLFPRPDALGELLALINIQELAPLWAEDETIGWIYQYWNSKEERKAMRDASAAPRNSRELAVRNQFFTPRYVVEFLTDNTLGRIWYEMCQGQTRLKDQCQYLVRRPDEVFLGHMTRPCDDAEEGVLQAVKYLCEGRVESFPEFSLGCEDDCQRLIDLAHSVDGYARYPLDGGGSNNAHSWLAQGERRWSGTTPEFEGITTQALLDFLFLAARADRQSGGIVKDEHGRFCGSFIRNAAYVNVGNEIRRRMVRGRSADLSQEELLKQPVIISHRPIKDPREIRLLDPACGSMHFGLYAFDLFETIYMEAWQANESFREQFPECWIKAESISIRNWDSVTCFALGDQLNRETAMLAVHSLGEPYDLPGRFHVYCPQKVKDQSGLVYTRPLDDVDWSAFLKEGWVTVDAFRDNRPDYITCEEFSEEEAFANFRKLIPRLIIENNIHGVDIDARAVQIAGLSLWLRAQKIWRDTPAAERPRVRRSNIVCAEPMPGSDAMLEDFVQTLDPPLLGELVKTVFDKMQLAGEAGTLLKIEEEIRTSIDDAKVKWEKLGAAELDLFSAEELNQTLRPGAQQELTGVEKALTTDHRPLTTDFFDTAEERIYAALSDYAESAEAGDYQRRLFAEDAAHGFAFIDLCRQRYDAVVMNPPFGDASLPSKPYIDTAYGDTKGDVYKAFVECYHARIVPTGLLGIVSSRTGFFLSWSEDWRTRVVMRSYRPLALADLGMGVLDAMVEVAAYVLRTLSEDEARSLTLSLVSFLSKVARDKQDRFSLSKWQDVRDGIKRHQALEELLRLEANDFIQACPGAHVRYTPHWKRVNEAIAPHDPVYPPLVCVRALEADDKATAVLAGVKDTDEGQQFVCDPKSFEGVPGTPFAYWVSRSFLNIGTRFSSFEPSNGHVRVGVQTDNDPRFVRTWWEICPSCVAKPIRESSSERSGWVPFLKGDESSTFHFDHPLVLNWQSSGAEVKAATEDAPGGRINNEVDYFKAGISWALRTAEFSPHTVPIGCIPSVSRYLAIPASSGPMATIGLWNSSVMDAICKFRMERHGHPKFIIGVVKETPFPDLSPQTEKQLADLAQTIWYEKASRSSFDMTSHLFCLPCIQTLNGKTLAEQGAARSIGLARSSDTIATTMEKIEETAFSLYGLSASDRTALNSSPLDEPSGEPESPQFEDQEGLVETGGLVSSLTDYALGSSLGRWDIRYATCERQPPELPDPFDPLPVCPPGMLQNADGLPAAQFDVPDDYPLPITWPGILVSDPGHPEDIVARVRDALAVIWGDRSAAIEQEACEILDVRTLRDYFAEKKSGGKFFKDHLKRYSKSRRQAPIYWPLSTESGTYTLWLYYHRLNEDTLYACITNFVAPKQEQAEKTLARLAAKGDARTRAEDKEYEQSEALIGELATFRAELERLAKIWKPNLNDGVQVTAAPLWSLFRLKPWQTKLKATWKSLEKGEYDWAHLAHTLWPERVIKKCAEDRSLAIAHGYEDDLWEEVEDDKGKIKWQPKKDAEEIADDLIRKKTCSGSIF